MGKSDFKFESLACFFHPYETSVDLLGLCMPMVWGGVQV